jgi:hypothetical protein
MTRRVLESLRAADVASSDPVFAEALAFVDRCQTSNGASLYSPVELALNKGQRSADDETLGYGSATADSLLARAAAGAPSDTRARQALAWLEAHHTPTENPGVSGGPMEPFASAMRGYYRAGAARCFRAFGGPKRWRGELIEAIAAEQGSDGSWQNESSLQKEDEPIIATAFAVDALTSCLFVGSS